MDRLNRFYLALSRTSRLMRERDERVLLAEICRICVETGHAVMACIYLRQGDFADRVASAGPAAEIFAKFPQPWDLRSPEAQASLTFEAMDRGATLVSQDYQNEPRALAWRELALQHHIGSMAWLPVHRAGQPIGVLMLAAPVKDFFGAALVELLEEMVGNVSYALDTIDLDAARLAALHQAEQGFERFSRLFGSAPLPAAIISRVDHRVVDANEACCRRYQVTRDELIGHRMSTLGIGMPDADRARFYAEMDRHRRVKNFTTSARNRAGEVRPELLNGESIDYLGEPCHLTMSLDLTDLQEAERSRQALVEAQLASKAKTEFLSRMSHELRTPLNAVLGFTQLLQSDTQHPPTPQQHAQLEHIRRAGWHLLALVNDVLDVSRIETGNLQVEPEALELAPLIDDAMRMTEPLGAAQRLMATVECGAGPAVWVQADPIRLRQVMINLLSNAFKYNRPGGSVRVEARVEGEHARIDVIDTGLGMTTEQLEHLFEPFNRLGREHQGSEGAGIGLVLTRQLLRLMRGTLEVASEAGVGTRVSVTLPAAKVPAKARAAPELRGAADPRSGVVGQPAPRGLVLYIEDNPVNTLLVEQFLAGWADVRLLQAVDGQSGIELARALQPDLILLDMMLPDMNGIQVLRELRAAPLTRGLRVAVLSASAMPEDVALARTEGATAYWTKPLAGDRFLGEVRQMLASVEP